MTAFPHLRRGWSSWLILGGLASGFAAPAITPDTPVQLPAYEVTDTTVSIYQPIEKNWSRAETPGFVFFSHDDDIARRLNEHLQRMREAMDVIMPSIAAATQRTNVTVVICHGTDHEHGTWTGRTDADAPGAFVTTIPLSQGSVLVVNADAETRAVMGSVTGTTAAEITRAFTLVLLHQVPGMPRWLAEGLAQVLKGTEARGKKITVGRNEMFVNVDDHALIRFRLAASAAPRDQETTKSNASTVVTVRGSPTALLNRPGDDLELYNFGDTYGEALDKIDEILDARRTGAASSYAEFFASHNDACSLAQLVDPATPDSTKWRMTAWAFVHMGLYPSDPALKANFTAFNRQLAAGTAPDAAFQSAYGHPAKEFPVMLARFSQRGRYLLNIFKLEEPLADPARPAFTSVGDREILPLKAAILAHTHRPDEAVRLLKWAYGHRESRSPAAANLLAQLIAPTDPAGAAAILEREAKSSPPAPAPTPH